MPEAARKRDQPGAAPSLADRSHRFLEVGLPYLSASHESLLACPVLLV